MTHQSPNAEALKRLETIEAYLKLYTVEEHTDLMSDVAWLASQLRASLEAEQLLVEALEWVNNYENQYGHILYAEKSEAALANHAKLRGSHE